MNDTSAWYAAEKDMTNFYHVTALPSVRESYLNDFRQSSDVSIPTYFYNFRLHMNGEQQIKKVYCDSRTRVDYSHSMMPSEPQPDN